MEIAKNYGVTLTLPTGPIPFGLILAFVGFTAFPLWVGYEIHAWQIRKRAVTTPIREPSPVEPPQLIRARTPNEFFTKNFPIDGKNYSLLGLDTQLSTLVRAGYFVLLRAELFYVGDMLANLKNPQLIPFLTWNEANRIKEIVIGDKETYDVLEDFSRTLNNRNNALEQGAKAEFRVYNDACIELFKKLEDIFAISDFEVKRREWYADDVVPPLPIESVPSFLKMPLRDWLGKKLPNFCNVQVKSVSEDHVEGWSEVTGIVQDSNLVPYRFTFRLDSKGKIDKKKSYVE
jgi:hypothetical protein